MDRSLAIFLSGFFIPVRRMHRHDRAVRSKRFLPLLRVMFIVPLIVRCSGVLYTAHTPLACTIRPPTCDYFEQSLSLLVS
jgi:hypothetical protein